MNTSNAPTESVFAILQDILELAQICLNRLDDVEDRLYDVPKLNQSTGSTPPSSEPQIKPSIERIAQRLREKINLIAYWFARVQNHL